MALKFDNDPIIFTAEEEKEIKKGIKALGALAAVGVLCTLMFYGVVIAMVALAIKWVIS